MSMALGGLGYMSLRNPFSELFSIFQGKGDLRSMFCLIVFLIVSLVLAYLTNPSENSFRAYLTEQSFRHHLSRLDENADDPNTYRSRFALRNSNWSSTHNFQSDNAPPFHFANRASIALRTPKHVFHSFAIFTIAAMVPLSKPSEGETREGWMISDSWYIGAFGKWWRGGVLEAWYQDVISRSKDEESWSSGILSMKRLDMLQDYNGPTFTTKNLPATLRGSPPKLRNRERPTIRHNAAQPRSSTPPPLPKSATLPMHATRKTLTNGDRISDRSSQVQPQPHIQPSLTTDNSRHGSSVSRSSSSSFEHSPIIAEVLRQISSAKASVLELRNQLSECETHTSHAHAVLQHEVDTHRERKRQEDCTKHEIKARTKTLEDSKRSAEALKREADKKLKVVQSLHDNTIQRMQCLDKGIGELQQNLSADRQFIANHQSTISDVEHEISENLESKRQEIKDADDLLAVLNQRSRELEDKLASDKGRLQLIREATDFKQSQIPLQYSPQLVQQADGWASNAIQHSGQPPASIMVQNGDEWDMVPDNWDQSPFQDDRQYTSDHMLNLSSVSPNAAVRNVTVDHSISPFNAYSPFADLAQCTQLPARSNSNNAAMESPELTHIRSLRAKDIPSNRLAPAMESNISRSFQSDSDPYIDREWRSNGLYPTHFQDDSLDSHFPTTSSPTSLHANPLNTPEDNLLETRFLPSYDYDHQGFDSPIDVQGPTWISSDFLEPKGSDFPIFAHLEKDKSNRWFAALSQDRTRGLNPDAKEFNLTRKSRSSLFSEPHGHLPTGAAAAYDALNPNGLGPGLPPAAASSSQSLLRAFAPSPAEREALQRALGGSTNTSFERLPSLSDVGSIPASPTSAHAHAHGHGHPHTHALPLPLPHAGRALGSLLPAWLQSLPRARKVKFSPWEDEEPAKDDAKAKEVPA